MASKEREILEGKIKQIVDDCEQFEEAPNGQSCSYTYIDEKSMQKILSSVLDAIEKLYRTPGYSRYDEGTPFKILTDIRKLLGGNDE